MSDVDVTVFYNEHRVAAMVRALRNTGTILEDRLERALDSIYQELVPETEREQIEAQITRESSEEYTRQQAARQMMISISLLSYPASSTPWPIAIGSL